MSQEHLEIGKIHTKEQERDAIHIAVAPVIAEHGNLSRGMPLVFSRKGDTNYVAMAGVTYGTNAVGIVDPFLNRSVMMGERFWMFLFPGTIVSLRHEWVHAAWVQAKGEKHGNARRIVEEYASKEGFTADGIADFIRHRFDGTDTVMCGDQEMYGLSNPEFIKAFNTFTGMNLPERTSFSCAC